MLWMQWMQVLLGYFPWQLTVDEASLSSFPAIAIFCLWLRHRVKRYAVISTCACLLTKNVECPPHMISGHLHIFFAEILPFYLGCLPSFWWFSQVLHILNTISLSEVTCRCVLTFSVLPFHIFFFFLSIIYWRHPHIHLDSVLLPTYWKNFCYDVFIVQEEIPSDNSD
jgi:hypothetical protein